MILIVAGHCDGLSGWKSNNIADKFFENLLRGGTGIFMFISGFMFYHVYFHNFDYRGFVRKKISKVLIPYLIMSTPAIIYMIIYKNHALDNLHGASEWVSSILFYYTTGNTIDGYWYIPVIMIIFLLSPIFNMFIRLKVGIQIFILLATFFVGSFIHRPINNINIVHSILYYMSFYLFGILCSIYKKNIYDCQKGLEYVFLAVAILLAWYQAAFISTIGNFHKELFQYNGIDILFLQKLFLILFFMMWLHKFEKYNLTGLSFIAKVSFPIYFLHPYIIKFLMRAKDTLHGYDIHTPLLMVALSTTTVLLLSSSLALFTKRVLRKNSQMLIGW